MILGKEKILLAQDLIGVSERIRTADLPLRRRTLYPAELRKQIFVPETVQIAGTCVFLFFVCFAEA